MEDARRQKKKAARLQRPPGASQHRVEVIVIAGKVQRGAAQHRVGRVIRE
jgi:hypothetical protein